jgi:GNAT superfamily N-acetyltransferase
MEWRNEDFLISDDTKLLSIDKLLQLYAQTWWAKDDSKEKVERLFNFSFWLGLHVGNRLVGIVRAVTDRTTHCWIMDFVIDKEFQNRGLGTWMMRCLLEHPAIEPTHMGLGTQDKDSFFEKFGFERDGSVMLRAWRPAANPRKSATAILSIKPKRNDS